MFLLSREFPSERRIFLLDSGGFTSNSKDEQSPSAPLIRITRGFRILSESFTSRRITESGSQTDPEILEQKELQLLRSNSLKSSGGNGLFLSSHSFKLRLTISVDRARAPAANCITLLYYLNEIS